MNKDMFIKEFSEQIRQSEAAVFAGAGLSVSAGFVDWKKLLKPLADKLGLSMDKEDDYPEIAQYYCNHVGSRTNINNKIINEFRKNIPVSENINILTRLPIDTYWTTNYDCLLEKGLEKNRRSYEIKISEESLVFSQSDRSATVFKMHGDVHCPESIVLTKDDYETYGRKKEGFTTVLKSHLLSKSFLFIGFSFDDPNLKNILAWIKTLLKDNRRQHYCLFEKLSRKQGESDDDFKYRERKKDYRIKDLKRYGIEAVVLDSYEEIPGLLTDIEEQCNMGNIFLSGSISIYSKEWPQRDVDDFAEKLANNLVSKKFRITSGYGLGIGSAIITGALTESRDKMYAHFDECLKLYPFPQPAQGEDFREKWHEYREEIMRDCGTVVFIFGNKKSDEEKSVLANGMMDEFEIAKRKGCIIIPVASTGWAAERIYGEMIKEKEKYLYLEGNWEILKEERCPEKITDIITDIIRKKQLCGNERESND